MIGVLYHRICNTGKYSLLYTWQLRDAVKTLSWVIYHSSAQNSLMAHNLSLTKRQSSFITYTSLCDQPLLTSLTSSLAPLLYVTIFLATLASCYSLKMPGMLPPTYTHTHNFVIGFFLFPRALLPEMSP